MVHFCLIITGLEFDQKMQQKLKKYKNRRHRPSTQYVSRLGFEFQ